MIFVMHIMCNRDFPRGYYHDVTSSDDYVTISFPETNSCNQILPEMCSALICNAMSQLIAVAMTYFAEKSGPDSINV